MNVTEIVQAILKAHNEKGYTYFGVRTGRTAEIGEILERSHDWDYINDWYSEELLPGTCSTGIGFLWFDGESEDEEEIAKAIALHIDNRYDGEMTYIIGGKNSSCGEDSQELIITASSNNDLFITGAEVIYIIA